MENFNAGEGEGIGKRAAVKIADAAEAAGQKLDAVVDYMESTKQSAKQTLDQVRQEGWKGMRGKILEYTRNEPFNALLIALGTGLLLGFFTKRTRA